MRTSQPFRRLRRQRQSLHGSPEVRSQAYGLYSSSRVLLSCLKLQLPNFAVVAERGSLAFLVQFAAMLLFGGIWAASGCWCVDASWTAPHK